MLLSIVILFLLNALILTNAQLNITEFDTARITIDGGYYQLLALPKIESTGLVNISSSVDQSNGLVMYAAPNVLPSKDNPSFIDNEKQLLAVGETDEVGWFFLASTVSRWSAVETNVTVSVTRIETIELESGSLSDFISLGKDQIGLIKLKPNVSANGVVYLNVFTTSKAAIYCNVTSPHLIPSMVAKNRYTEFPVFLTSLDGYGMEWYFVIEASFGDLANLYVMATTAEVVQLESDKEAGTGVVMDNQVSMFHLPAKENYGGIVKVFFKCPEKNETDSCVVRSGYNGVVIRSGDTLVANEDNVDWYFTVTFGKHLNDGAFGISVISYDRIYVPYKLNPPYMLLKVDPSVSLNKQNLVIETNENIQIAVGSQTINRTFINVGSKYTISNVNVEQDPIYWILCKTNGSSFKSATLKIDLSGTSTISSGNQKLSKKEHVFYYEPAQNRGDVVKLNIFGDTQLYMYTKEGWYNVGNEYYSRVLENKGWWFLAKSLKGEIDFTVYALQTTNVDTLGTFVVNPDQLYVFKIYSDEGAGVVRFNHDSLSDNVIIKASSVIIPRNSTNALTSQYFISESIDKVDIYATVISDVSCNLTITAILASIYATMGLNHITTKYPYQILWLGGFQIAPSIHLSYVTPDNPVTVYVKDSSIPAPVSENEVKDTTWVIGKQLRPEWFMLIHTHYWDGDNTNLENSLTVNITTTGVVQFCNPVLYCNGHGHCPDKHSDATCNCLRGIGYGFIGERCDIEDREYIWAGFFFILGSAFILLVFFGINALVLKVKHNTDSYTLLPQDATLSQVTPVDIKLTNVGFTTSKGKELLQGINCCLQSGTLTAIMGPSGSGKSTLLKLLAGETSATDGIVELNGSKKDISSYRTIVGYVPQDDIIYPSLTVFENIAFAAELRRTWTPDRINRTAKDTITQLELKREIHHQVIGDGISERQKISGGERKRVSIGLDLVVNPSVLFLDEPTSGLDSKTTLELVRLLKRIAVSRNINIIAVIHQPRVEVYKEFDNLLLLKSGRQVYFGTPITVGDMDHFLPPEHFSANPADLILDYIDEIRDTIPGQARYGTNRNKIKNKPLPNFLSQTITSTKRAFIQEVRNTPSVLLFGALVLIAAFVIGYLSFKDSTYVGPVPTNQMASCPSFIRGLCAMPRDDTYPSQGMLICLALGLTSLSSFISSFKEYRY